MTPKGKILLFDTVSQIINTIKNHELNFKKVASRDLGVTPRGLSL